VQMNGDLDTEKWSWLQYNSMPRKRVTHKCSL